VEVQNATGQGIGSLTFSLQRGTNDHS